MLTEGRPPLVSGTPSAPNTAPAMGSMTENHHSPSAQALRSLASNLLLPSTVVIPAKAGISLLLTKRRKEKRDPSFRWDDGGNPTVRFPPSIAVHGRSAPGFPVSSPSALGRDSGRKTLILPWQGRWLAEGQTEGCPAIVRVTPLRPALRARHLPFQGRMAENHHSRHSREGGNPTLYRVSSVGCRPAFAVLLQK